MPGGGVSDAASDPHAASADGTEFNVDSGKRVIVVPGRQSNEPDDDVRDLLIAQQVRRIDELEHRVEMLNIILRKRRAKSRPCDIADDDGTAVADDSSDTTNVIDPSAA
ncbi:hypothetical protein [Bifidobacterium ramosum]|uniref:Transposase n=1 Tax=Bifidobacterium ramosum TaxID=1798158 RepID=A0A7K3TDE2_9BIFI|nr:hypothetical protein [Bifidobacterium ramosum]NEG71703.1 hypothetical protein [Bifidobacterium ramosum]